MPNTGPKIAGCAGMFGIYFWMDVFIMDLITKCIMCTLLLFEKFKSMCSCGGGEVIWVIL